MSGKIWFPACVRKQIWVQDPLHPVAVTDPKLCAAEGTLGFKWDPQQAAESAWLWSQRSDDSVIFLQFSSHQALISVYVFWAAWGALCAVVCNHLMSWSGFLVINVHILTVGTAPFSILCDTHFRNDRVKTWLWSGNVFSFLTAESKLAGCTYWLPLQGSALGAQLYVQL